MKPTLDALSTVMLLMAAGSLGATLTLHWAVRAKLKLVPRHRGFDRLLACLSAPWRPRAYLKYIEYSGVRARAPQSRNPAPSTGQIPCGEVLGARRRSFRPPISVLKPLCGVDEGLYENLVSFVQQGYPQFELVFGIADPHDPALAVVQRLRADYPGAPIRLVVHGELDLIANPKVITLLHAMRIARYEHVLVSDSNIRAAPDYLESIAAEMEDPNVGLVSNLILAGGGRSLGAQCENLHLNTFVLGGVCIADLSAHPCVIGKSMLMRRSELQLLGGFESMRAVLAEDYVLGQRYHAAGYRVVLSCHAIRTENRKLSLTRFVARHLRWAQLRRWCALGPFFGESLLYATPWLAAPLMLQDSLSSSGFLCVAAVLVRIGSDGVLARGVTGRWPSIAVLALIPLKDTLLLGVWMVALCRRSVHWRGHQLRIGPGTRLSPVRGQDTGVPAAGAA